MASSLRERGIGINTFGAELSENEAGIPRNRMNPQGENDGDHVI